MKASSVTLDIDLFWKLISDSQLLNADQIDAVKTKWSSDDATKVADALVAEKVISALHRDVILAGHSGPFLFGRYLVTDRLSPTIKGDLFRPFAGRDLRSQHPVMLNFFTGTSTTAIKDWKKVESRVRKLAKCRHGNLIETFQAISLPDYRFVVSELPIGTRLSEKLPPKGRLKLAQAAPIVLQLSLAVQSQIESGIDALLPPTDKLPAHIWLGAKGATKFQPQWTDQYPPHSKTPTQTLAALLMKMAGGDFPTPTNIKTLIEKSGVEGDLKTIVQKSFDDDADQTLDVEKFTAALKQVSPEFPKPATLKSAAAFRQVLSTSQFLATPTVAPVQSVPDIEDNVDPELRETSDDPRVLAAQQSAQQRKASRWKMPTAVAAGLIGMLAIGGIWATTANQEVIRHVAENTVTEPKVDPSALSTANDDTDQDIVDITGEGITDAGNTDEAITENMPPDFSNVGYLQEILEDDATRLWESPTTGKPIDFRYMPSSSEILFHARPFDLVQSDDGQRLLNGLSTTFAQPLATLNGSVGIPLEQMQTLTAALYPGNSGSYQAIFHVTATQDVSIDDLKSVWGDADEVRTKDGKRIFATADYAYLISSSDSDNAISFVAGEPKLVQTLALQNGNSVLARQLQRLARRTDRDRHLSFLASPKSLTDRFGRQLWGAMSSTIVPELRVFFPDEINGFSILMHVDDGDYLEFHVDHSLDVTAKAFAQQLESQFRNTLNTVGTFADGLPEMDYWNNVRQRTLPMAERLSNSLRWGVEFKNVVANAWLPPNATQNLVAASELTLAFANTVAPSEIADAKPSPQTMKELLATRRSLNNANPPDLNILLTELASDINDDFPDMPFQLKIKLMGNDLQKDGITQNQRPGPLAFNDMSLAEILTTIMTSANPDKDISGPADPNCKLVWVVVEDESTNTQSIAVTTRAAAASRSEALPEAFVAP